MQCILPTKNAKLSQKIPHTYNEIIRYCQTDVKIESCGQTRKCTAKFEEETAQRKSFIAKYFK